MDDVQEREDVAAEGAEKVTRDLYELDDGKQGSRAAYIRQEFQKGRSRRELADELGVTYNIIHSATANMDNGTVGVGGGARVFVELEDGTKLPRADYIRQQIEAGKSRSELAKELGVAHGVVYAASKGMVVSGKTGGKVMVEDPDTGEEAPRVDVIRKLFAAGNTRREIANLLHCDYSIVWTATKPPKGEKAEDENAEGEAEEEDYNEEDDQEA